MTPENSPYLCGGTLFDLLIAAKQQARPARDKWEGGADLLSEKGLMAGLIYAVTGDEIPVYGGDSFGNCVSNYKKCEKDNSTYIPFTQASTISTYDAEVKRKNPDLLQRMSEFVDSYILSSKYKWLARAILEVISQDAEIEDSTEFAITTNDSVSKGNINGVTYVELPPFLVSVLHYIFLNRQDNEKGKTTFEAWHEQSGQRKPWRFRSDCTVGSSITQEINVVSTFTAPSVTVEHTEKDYESMSDDEVINDSILRSGEALLDAFSQAKHRMADDIREKRRFHDREDTAEEAEFVEADPVSDTPDDTAKNVTIIQQQTNVIQNGENNSNITNNGSITINFGGGGKNE